MTVSKRILAATLLVFAPLALGACGSEAAPPPVADKQAIPDLAFEDSALILPAVTGRPGVVYGTFINTGDRDLAIRTVAVKGAGKTELHASMEMNGQMTMGETGPQLVPANGRMKLEAGGLHVMVFDIAPEIAAGGTAALTVTVAGGDSATFEIPVRAAGDPR